MSSCGTHMLIGAVGGLALARVMPPIGVEGLPPVLVEMAVVGASALLATWPDIDEPRSYISRRMSAVVVLLGVALGALMGFALAGQGKVQPLAGATLGALGGACVGTLAGVMLLRTIRAAAGGHRRLTHSLLVGALLAALAGVLWMGGMGAWALVPMALAWGQALHILGDIVTPAGLPLLYPLNGRSICVLPLGLAYYGEFLVAVLAMIVGYALVRG
jgi:membrane-bound metal-dependent hydrolase YbcI (DUF457 family)